MTAGIATFPSEAYEAPAAPPPLTVEDVIRHRAQEHVHGSSVEAFTALSDFIHQAQLSKNRRFDRQEAGCGLRNAAGKELSFREALDIMRRRFCEEALSPAIERMTHQVVDSVLIDAALKSKGVA